MLKQISFIISLLLIIHFKTYSQQKDSLSNTIHVFVALCDNENQGIVPVPTKIGNGQDPKNNLYWGCKYGISTFFKNSTEWTLIEKQSVDSIILERLTFKHKTQNFYLIADAYNGKNIKECTIDYFNACAGLVKDTLTTSISNIKIPFKGCSKLVSYIGHDGLMDFDLEQNFINSDKLKRKTIILACSAKAHMGTKLKQTNAYPILWTSSLLSPEAYTLHDCLQAYLNQKSNQTILNTAITTYMKYQKCNKAVASYIFETGW